MGIKASQNPFPCTPAVPARFLGEFASLSALQTAHPLPQSGSYAIVNETGDDLIYFWSDDDQVYFTISSTPGGSFDGTFVDSSSIADWKLLVDAGEFYFYRNDGSTDRLKLRIESDRLSFFDDAGNIKYSIQKPASGTSSLIAPATTADETIATREWANAQGFEKTANKGTANGYTPLNSSAKIDASYLPDSILGQVNYQNVWNASTNSPAIPTASSSNKGWYYIVSVAGTTTINGISDWQVGDWIISNGSVWSKVDNTDAISSFNGRTGAITLVTSDITTALGFTPEDSANKSTSTSDSASTSKFPVWAAIVSYFSASRIRSILGISALSGSNTGDETTSSIQTKRPLKTVASQSLEGSGNITLSKSDVGLGNVDNTSDLNKPISTATQTALNLKADAFYFYKIPTTAYVTGTTSETEVLRIEIPANTFSATDVLKAHRFLFEKIGTAGGFTARLKISTSATMPSGTTDQIGQIGLTGATTVWQSFSRNLYIDGGNIKGWPFTASTSVDNSNTTTAVSSRAFDRSVTQYLYVSITLANSADQVRLGGGLVSNI